MAKEKIQTTPYPTLLAFVRSFYLYRHIQSLDELSEHDLLAFMKVYKKKQKRSVSNKNEL